MVIDGVDIDDEIPLPNVKGDILAKVVEFCTHYALDPMTEFEKVNCYISLTLYGLIIEISFLAVKRFRPYKAGSEFLFSVHFIVR